MGGQERWYAGAAAIVLGQPTYPAALFRATKMFERRVSACPLTHSSGNAPDSREVFGTLALGLLAGHRRHAHITP